MPSKSRLLSPLLLLCGVTILALVIVLPPHEKISIVGSAFGLLIALEGLHLLDERNGLVIGRSMTWLRYLPLPIGIAVSLLGLLSPLPIVSAFGLAVALTLLFTLSTLTNVSKVHIACLAVLIAASIGYNIFFYYPLINGVVDTWGYLSVASAIVQRGRFPDVISALASDRYYFPLPIMSIDSAILSSVTGINLELSMLLCPGSLILLQPLLVFLLSRSVFDDNQGAALSAFIAVTESAVTVFIGGPIAQSMGISLLFLFLILLFRRMRSGNHVGAAFLFFLMLTAAHGAVGLISIALVAFVTLLERSSDKRIILPLVVMYLGYVMMTNVMEHVIRNVRWTVESILDWIFTPTLRTGSELYGTGSNGLTFIWWGLPVALALFYVMQRRKQGSSWVYAGLGLLGLSFVANVIAPQFPIERYGGLAAWLILAMTGGTALRTVARTRRQLVVLVPLMLIVCLSAVVNPALSPQFGFYQAYGSPLPTTNADRTALEWVNRHVFVTVLADSVCRAYLIFSRYQSGTLNISGIVKYDPRDMLSALKPGYALFVRSNISMTHANGQTYHCFVSVSVNPQSNQVINIIYNSGCDAVEISGWI